MSGSYYTQPKTNYTITQAKQDIDFLQNKLDALEASGKSSDDEISTLRAEVYMLRRQCESNALNMDVLARLIRLSLAPDEQKNLIHRVLDAIRKDNMQKKELINAPA